MRLSAWPLNLLILLLWTTAANADPRAALAQVEASPIAMQSTPASLPTPAANEGLALSRADQAFEHPDSPTATAPSPMQTGGWLSEFLQAVSPLPVLALGILGLLWVRRHTAEL